VLEMDAIEALQQINCLWLGAQGVGVGKKRYSFSERVLQPVLHRTMEWDTGGGGISLGTSLCLAPAGQLLRRCAKRLSCPGVM